MHAISHSLAHRAPPASRTRVRWQPYNNTSIPTPLPNFCLLTPTSVSSNSSPATPEVPRTRLPPTLIPITKESHVRDTSKHKYALGLVDQAVKSLTEIWPTSQIPCVFINPSTISSQPFTREEMRPAPLRRHNTQLPSPVSPCTQASPAIQPATLLAVPGANSQTGVCEQGSLVPIKAFVHEVLRRSRTSGGILQTALCYLEAIRHQVPELASLEQQGLGVQGEPESASRIIQDEAPMSVDESICTASSDKEEVNTIRVSELPAAHKPVVAELAPLPPLPSPLLCPRRAFLASLILASKFTQDKCYSNRAWAKLSGLPPREIGRCERALGEALDWRLWVGKLPEPTPARAPMVRTKSEGSILATPPSISTPPTLAAPLPVRQNSQSGLRRCATLPVEAYESKPWTETPEPPFSASFASTYSRENSPGYSTPGLSYSPSSTASSSLGDQTIQSGFIEDTFCSGTSFVNVADNIAEMDTIDAQANWPWHPSHANYSQPFNIASGNSKLNNFISDSGFPGSGYVANY